MTQIADVFYCTVGLICCVTWLSLLVTVVVRWFAGYFDNWKRKK